jgi:hypothetical protein
MNAARRLVQKLFHLGYKNVKIKMSEILFVSVSLYRCETLSVRLAKGCE